MLTTRILRKRSRSMKAVFHPNIASRWGFVHERQDAVTADFSNFLIVIVLSLVSVGAFSYVQSSRALDGQVKQYMEQMIDSANYQTDSYLQAYELLSNAFPPIRMCGRSWRSNRMIRTSIMSTAKNQGICTYFGHFRCYVI